jgi:DAK2 domain fusion protein YloV
MDPVEPQQDGLATFDLEHFVRYADLAVEALGAHREEIDDLNVYPVPDGDTGTNMYLTVEAARDAMRTALEEKPGDIRVALPAYAKGALLGAKGNSGVILSQLIGALFRRIGQSRPDDRAAQVFAEGMQMASDAAFAAVGTPVEGTILSVAKAAATAALIAVDDPDNHLAEVIGAATDAARIALERTPDQMELLRQAGVVDAGGEGLCVVLDAAEQALTGRRPDATPRRRARRRDIDLPTGDLTEDGPAYEVMYLLEADDDAIAPLRTELLALGDSLVVVGGEGLWNVHVHVHDVGAAVEEGIRAGHPSRIAVTHFAEQVARARERLAPQEGRKVVVLAAGPGLANLFTEAGAEVVRFTTMARPSAPQILDALRACGAREIVVLPNDGPNIAACEAAAAAAAAANDQHVVVIPTRAQVQGIAALAVHDPTRPMNQDVISMTSAAKGARDGGVTVATDVAMTSAGPCEPGDVLGITNGDFSVVGDDLYDVSVQVLSSMMSAGELITLVSGADGGDLAQRVETWLHENHPAVDVLVYDGGQARYPLLFSVE